MLSRVMYCNYNIIYRANSFLCNSRQNWWTRKKEEQKEKKEELKLHKVLEENDSEEEGGPLSTSTPKEREEADDDMDFDYPTTSLSNDTKISTGNENNQDLNTSYSPCSKIH